MLKELRRKNGITQQEIANMLGIPVSTYNQYENGKRMIPAEVVDAICIILKIDSSVFLAKNFTVREA